MKIRIALGLTAVLLMACDGLTTELERDPRDVPGSQILELERAGCCPLVADGSARDLLSAWIPRRAKATSVTFKVPRGGFLEAAGGKELVVRAIPVHGEPERLRAQATFVIDTVPAPVGVTATVAGEQALLVIDVVERLSNGGNDED